MNFLWEAWLEAFTERANEAIVNSVQGKSDADYERLMTAALREIRRVLRPGRWLTLVFHNSSERVWQSLQAAISESGFSIGSVHVFDKSQETVKQAVANNAVGYDIVINCQKTTMRPIKLSAAPNLTAELRIYVEDYLASLPADNLMERDERKLFSRVLGHLLKRYQTITLSFAQFRQMLADCCENRGGYWYLPGQSIDHVSQCLSGTLPNFTPNSRRAEYLVAAAKVLADAGKPLHSKEIYSTAVDRRLLDAMTHSPETLLATLSDDTKRPHTSFARVSRGRYALKPLDGIATLV